MSNPLLFILECGHVFPGKPGDIKTLCHYCNERKTITGVHVYEWKATCPAKGCVFGKWCGLARPLAEWHANQHAYRHPEHRPTMMYLVNPEAKHYQEKHFT